MTSTILHPTAFRRATATLAVLGACLFSVAHAAPAALPAAGTPSVTVSYADLNLASEEGANALYARIAAAARAVCAAESVDIRDLGAFTRVRACETAAITGAVNAVHSPRLASLRATYRQHG